MCRFVRWYLHSMLVIGNSPLKIVKYIIFKAKLIWNMFKYKFLIQDIYELHTSINGKMYIIIYIWLNVKTKASWRVVESVLATELQIHLNPQSHWQWDESLQPLAAICTCTLAKYTEINQCSSPLFLSPLHFRGSEVQLDRHCTLPIYLAKKARILMGETDPSDQWISSLTTGEPTRTWAETMMG